MFFGEVHFLFLELDKVAFSFPVASPSVPMSLLQVSVLQGVSWRASVPVFALGSVLKSLFDKEVVEN